MKSEDKQRIAALRQQISDLDESVLDLMKIRDKIARALEVPCIGSATRFKVVTDYHNSIDPVIRSMHLHLASLETELLGIQSTCSHKVETFFGLDCEKNALYVCAECGQKRVEEKHV